MKQQREEDAQQMMIIKNKKSLKRRRTLEGSTKNKKQTINQRRLLMERSEDKVIKVWLNNQVFFWIDIKFLLNQNLFEEPWSNFKYGS